MYIYVCVYILEELLRLWRLPPSSILWPLPLVYLELCSDPEVPSDAKRPPPHSSAPPVSSRCGLKLPAARPSATSV